MRLPWGGGAKRATITRSQNRILTLPLTAYIYLLIYSIYLFIQFVLSSLVRQDDGRGPLLVWDQRPSWFGWFRLSVFLSHCISLHGTARKGLTLVDSMTDSPLLSIKTTINHHIWSPPSSCQIVAMPRAAATPPPKRQTFSRGASCG
jgi:hypothetical protein